MYFPLRPCFLGRGVHTGATFLYYHRVHDPRKPTRLPEGVQQRGGQRCGAAPHGHTDLLCHGVPGEEKLYTQVGVKILQFQF